MQADAIGRATLLSQRVPTGAQPWRAIVRPGHLWVMSRFLAAVAALLLGAALAGCGGGSSRAAPSPTSTRRPTSSTASSRDAQVLAAYRAAWAAFEHAATNANPDDPLLAATMTGPQLEGVKANLLADQRQGIVGRGSFVLHPKIVSISATGAAVVDCVYSTAELVYKATGKPVPPVTPPEHDGVRATLVLSGGRWKVDKQTVTDGKCAPGS